MLMAQPGYIFRSGRHAINSPAQRPQQIEPSRLFLMFLLAFHGSGIQLFAAALRAQTLN